MSLVSYGASDDSDTDDGEITTNVQTSVNENKANRVAGHISDDDDFDTAVGSSSVTSTTSFGLRLPTVSDKAALLSSTTDDKVNSTSLTTLEDLPAPHSHLHTSETEENDLEEEVRPKASEIANAPMPPSKKQKLPVKITIPSLDEDHNDEEKESKKKTAPSTVKSGLFSLLPAPMHAAKKQTNRPLIPQSLTKKTTSATVSTTSSTGNKQTSSSMLKRTSEVASTTDISSKRMTPFNALTGYDSDSDDDEGSTTNFFSLASSSEVKTTDNTSEVKTTDNTSEVKTTDNTSEVKTTDNTSEVTRRRLQSEEVSSSKSEINSSIPNPIMQEESVEGSENGDGVKESLVEEKDPDPEPGAINDAPLDFMSMNRLSAWSGSSYGFLGPVGLTGPVPQSNSLTTYESSLSLPSSSEYNLASAEVSSEMEDEAIEPFADDDMKKFMNDKEFQKLQGKRKRGLDEAINFVDANVDDYVDPSEVTKYLTEETDYVSHKNKDNLPTAQQRRKKQITYLAYQAKERELELKNTWAQNRMTKKQTQSKYGF